jgi:hypothetical protein
VITALVLARFAVLLILFSAAGLLAWVAVSTRD